MKFLTGSLWIAAAFNVFAAYTLAFPSSGLGTVLELPGGTPVLYLALSSGFVFIFGCAYAWMALRGVNKPLLFLGACGKASAFLMAVVLWILDQASAGVALFATGDAIFATVWFVWLGRNRTSNTS